VSFDSWKPLIKFDHACAHESQGFGAGGQLDRRLRKSRIGEDSEADIRKLFKRNILDSLGCAIAALPGAPFAALREQFAEYRSDGSCSQIGGGKDGSLKNADA
jgi:hypothetical protein